jgi:hypothetical protein
MHVRRLAALILGAWLAGAPLVALLALHNADSVAQLMSWPPPQAARNLSILGPADSRALLTYQVYELNGACFEAWQWAQLALGAVLFVVLVFGYRTTRPPLVLCGFMIAVTIAALCYVIPDLQRLGRIASFLPTGAAEIAAFRKYTITYAGIELVKWLSGFLLATLLLRRSYAHSSTRHARSTSKSKWVRAS